MTFEAYQKTASKLHDSAITKNSSCPISVFIVLLTNRLTERALLEITYANKKVEKYFSDYSVMTKKIGLDLTRGVKKQLGRLIAANTFGDFLSLGLGHPEQLVGCSNIRYSIRVSANARLIIEPNATEDSLMICSEVEIKGVSDYHGSKDNWYIP